MKRQKGIMAEFKHMNQQNQSIIPHITPPQTAQGAHLRQKKKEGENGTISNSNGGVQTIIIKQPIELITTKPEVIKVDPKK